MRRKNRSQKSLQREIGLIGAAAFITAALALIPIFVILLYAIAYMPFGIAGLLFLAWATRRFWGPRFRRRARGFLQMPQAAPRLRERERIAVPIIAPASEVQKPVSPSDPAADLRNIR